MDTRHDINNNNSVIQALAKNKQLVTKDFMKKFGEKSKQLFRPRKRLLCTSHAQNLLLITNHEVDSEKDCVENMYIRTQDFSTDPGLEGWIWHAGKGHDSNGCISPESASSWLPIQADTYSVSFYIKLNEAALEQEETSFTVTLFGEDEEELQTDTRIIITNTWQKVTLNVEKASKLKIESAYNYYIDQWVETADEYRHLIKQQLLSLDFDSDLYFEIYKEGDEEHTKLSCTHRHLPFTASTCKLTSKIDGKKYWALWLQNKNGFDKLFLDAKNLQDIDAGNIGFDEYSNIFPITLKYNEKENVIIAEPSDIVVQATVTITETTTETTTGNSTQQTVKTDWAYKLENWAELQRKAEKAYTDNDTEYVNHTYYSKLDISDGYYTNKDRLGQGNYKLWYLKINDGREKPEKLEEVYDYTKSYSDLLKWELTIDDTCCYLEGIKLYGFGDISNLGCKKVKTSVNLNTNDNYGFKYNLTSTIYNGNAPIPTDTKDLNNLTYDNIVPGEVQDMDLTEREEALPSLNHVFSSSKTIVSKQAEHAKTSTELDDNPIIDNIDYEPGGEKSKVYIQAGGKESNPLTVNYSKNSTTLTEAPVITVDQTNPPYYAFQVKAGEKTSEAKPIYYAEQASELTENPELTIAEDGKSITVTAGQKSSDLFTVPYAEQANFAETAYELEGPIKTRILGDQDGYFDDGVEIIHSKFPDEGRTIQFKLPEFWGVGVYEVEQTPDMYDCFKVNDQGLITEVAHRGTGNIPYVTSKFVIDPDSRLDDYPNADVCLAKDGFRAGNYTVKITEEGLTIQ